MMKYVFVASLSTAILVADQLSKWYIRETIPLYQHLTVIEGFFHITHVFNTGGAFSLFAGAHDAVRLPFFIGASVLAVGALVYFLRQVHEDQRDQRWLQFALASVLGGAFGNLTDRVVFGKVTDFILVHWHQYYWPAFNVADSFISIGVTLLLLQSFWGPPVPEQKVATRH
jgi:signal peptidase II